MTRLERTAAIVLIAGAIVMALSLNAVLSPAMADSGISTAYGPVSGYHCGPEDGPRWDWTRCGNHRRGIILRGGGSFKSRQRNVGPCVFTALRHQHEIDWRLTPHLIGDGHARRACAKIIARLNRS